MENHQLPRLDALGTHDVVSATYNAQSDSQQVVMAALAKIDFTLDAAVTYSFWEKQIHALMVHLVKSKMMSVDELRRGIENLEPQLYDSLTYYEKWTASMVTVLIERGAFSRSELESLFVDSSAAAQEGNITPPSQPFQVGDKVVVLREQHLNRWRKPHLRTPGYLHGAEGRVQEVLGQFLNPAYAAFRDLLRIDGGSQHEYLYAVSFPVKSIAVMATSHSAEDLEQGMVTADIFHPWLQKAGSTGPAVGRGGGVEVDTEGQKLLSQTFVDQKKRDYDAFKRQEAALKKAGKVAPHGPHLDRVSTEASAVCKEQDVTRDDNKVLKPVAEALITLLVRKKVVSLTELLEGVQKLDALTSKPGGQAAKMIAKAWVDPIFKKALLRDANAAATSIGIKTSNYASQSPSTHPGFAASRKKTPEEEAFEAMQIQHPHGTTIIRAVECTPETHHLIVCTLCSCYPAALLGMSPDWYKSRSFRAQAVLRPREMLAETFGLKLPPPSRTKIVVHDSTAEVRYIVVPMRPKGSEGMTEEQLEKLVTRDSMIGVSQLPEVTVKHRSHL